jgi:hypothetical protein
MILEKENKHLKTENRALLQQSKELQIKSDMAEKKIILLQENVVNVQSAALALAQAFTLEIERLKAVFNSENKTDSENTEKLISDGLRLEVLKVSEQSIALRLRAFTAEQKIVMLESNIATAVAKGQQFDAEIESLKAESKHSALEREMLLSKIGSNSIQHQTLIDQGNNLRMEIIKMTEASVALVARSTEAEQNNSTLQENLANLQATALAESQALNAKIGSNSIQHQTLIDQGDSLRMEIIKMTEASVALEARSVKAEQNNSTLQEKIANLRAAALVESQALNAEVERLKAESQRTNLKNEELLSNSGSNYIMSMIQNHSKELEILKLKDIVTRLQLKVDSIKVDSIENQTLIDQGDSLRMEIIKMTEASVALEARSVKAEQNNSTLQEKIANLRAAALAESQALNAEVERLKAESQRTNLKNEELLSNSGSQYIKVNVYFIHNICIKYDDSYM